MKGKTQKAKQEIKKKLRKKILAVIAGVLVQFLPVIIIATGLMAVVAFASAIVGHFTDRPDVDMTHYTIEEMLEAVDDKNVITEDVLNEMMIDRKSLKKLLQGVKNYNETATEKTIKIGAKNVKSVIDDEGNETITEEKDAEYMEVTVSNRNLESSYAIDWQPLYTMLVFDIINNKQVGTNSSFVDSSTILLDSNEGDKVIEYASQFVGNPYEWGGTSLTDGCDCSGFVMQVYDNFGVKLAHSSKSMQSSGEKVCDGIDTSVMMPGDIICYSGHVALYYGDDKIIHAKNKASGICISDISTESGAICVRRVMLGSDASATDSDASGIMSQGTYNPTTDYDEYYIKASQETGIPVALLKAVSFRESSFNPTVVSSAACVGLMQVSSVYSGYNAIELTDPETNIMAGAKILATNIKSKNSVVLGLVAYNRGPNASCFKNNTFTEKEFKYPARVLSTYTGNDISASELLAMDYSSINMTLRSYGTINQQTGRLNLTDTDVQGIINDFLPHFVYGIDVMDLPEDTLTYDECAALPNTWVLQSGDKHSENGMNEYLVPYSMLNRVELAYADIDYTTNEANTYTLRLDRWETKARYYCKAYDGEWLKTLIEILPSGQEAIGHYENIANKCTSTITSDGSQEGNYSIGAYYEPDDPYANVPLNSDGMTRTWSMSESDKNLIYMTDSEIWNLLCGISTTSAPQQVSESTMSARQKRVTIPIWRWKNPGTNDLTKVSDTMTLTVNQALASEVLHMFTDIYNDPSQVVINPRYTAGYVYRKSTSGKSLSVHSYGAAIDINWNSSLNGYSNGYYKDHCHTPTTAEMMKLPECQAKYEIICSDGPIACIFKAYGWVHGGTQWRTTWDGMHFSKVGDVKQSMGVTNHEKYYK